MDDAQVRLRPGSRLYPEPASPSMIRGGGVDPYELEPVKRLQITVDARDRVETHPVEEVRRRVRLAHRAPSRALFGLRIAAAHEMIGVCRGAPPVRVPVVHVAGRVRADGEP